MGIPAILPIEKAELMKRDSFCRLISFLRDGCRRCSGLGILRSSSLMPDLLEVEHSSRISDLFEDHISYI